MALAATAHVRLTVAPRHRPNSATAEHPREPDYRRSERTTLLCVPRLLEAAGGDVVDERAQFDLLADERRSAICLDVLGE